ncbi:MAG: methylenetetrahydrofolate reductase, partial [Methanobacteriota archaeon]
MIGGGATQVSGPYAEVMDLLEIGLLADYGIIHINIAGHPEGNPDDPDPEQSLIAKLNWADTHGMHSRILTQ